MTIKGGKMAVVKMFDADSELGGNLAVGKRMHYDVQTPKAPIDEHQDLKKNNYTPFKQALSKSTLSLARYFEARRRVICFCLARSFLQRSRFGWI